MKNWKKITLITGTVCTILGFFLLIFGLFAGGIQYLTSTDLGSFNNSDKSAAKVQKLVTEELSPYKNLDVSLDSLNLQVRYSKDNTYALSYKNTKTSKTKSTTPITWSQSGNTLKIRERNLKKHTWFHIDLVLDATTSCMSVNLSYSSRDISRSSRCHPVIFFPSASSFVAFLILRL